MSKKDDALKLALEALEAEHSAVYGTSRTARAITAIREAFMSGTDGAHAPEVREQPVRPYRLLQDNGSKYFGASWDKAEQPRGEATLAPATELRKQQSAERGEPVAVYVGETWCGSVVRLYEELPLETPLYTSPQSKSWVPLTEFDIDQIPYSCNHADSRLIAYAIEAKLKEKNGF